MFNTISRLGFSWGALFLLELAIKLLDDHLDLEEDSGLRFSLADAMGKGTLAYAMLFYAVSARFFPDWAFTIFISSYACGMLTGSDPLLPSGLSAWAEMLLVLTLGVIWSNGKEMLSSLALVMGVHLLDDVIDYRRQGQQVPTKNLAHCWGKVEVLLLGILCSLTALLLAPLKTVLSWLALPAALYMAANPWNSNKR